MNNKKPVLYALFQKIYSGEDFSEVTEQLVFTTSDEVLIRKIKETLTENVTTNSFCVRALYEEQFYETEYVLPELCLLPEPLRSDFIKREIPKIIKSAVSSINMYREKHLSGNFSNVFEKYMTMNVMEFIEHESGYIRLFSKYIDKPDFLKFFEDDDLLFLIEESDDKLIWNTTSQDLT